LQQLERKAASIFSEPVLLIRRIEKNQIEAIVFNIAARSQPVGNR
jgi:hypothetical protein